MGRVRCGEGRETGLHEYSRNQIPHSNDLFEDADEAFRIGKRFAIFVHLRVVGGKTLFELQIGLAIFPDIDCEVRACMLAISDEYGFQISCIPPKKLGPDSVAFICRFELGAVFGRYLKLPQDVDRGRLWIGSIDLPRA